MDNFILKKKREKKITQRLQPILTTDLYPVGVRFVDNNFKKEEEEKKAIKKSV